MRTNNKEDLIVDLKGLYVSFRTFKGYTKVLNGVNLHGSAVRKSVSWERLAAARRRQYIPSPRFWRDRRGWIREKCTSRVKMC